METLFAVKETIKNVANCESNLTIQFLSTWQYLKKAWASILLFILLEHMTATLKLLVVGILHECENVYKCCDLRQYQS